MDVASLPRTIASSNGAERIRQPDPAQNSASTAATPVAADETNRFDSPVVNFDRDTGAAILQFRDGVTGEQQFQIPTRATLEYQHSQDLPAASPAPTGSERKTVA